MSGYIFIAWIFVCIVLLVVGIIGSFVIAITQANNDEDSSLLLNIFIYGAPVLMTVGLIGLINWKKSKVYVLCSSSGLIMLAMIPIVF